MTVIWAKTALLETGWAENVRVKITADGRIGSIATGSSPEGRQVGLLLPAPANIHSHAFQRAMAGLTERRGPHGRDSFWSWRDLMYRFLDHLGPEDVEAIAALVQMEMLEAGYAAVAEFHYLHHQPGGMPYDNLAEMSARIAAAARISGIGLTLLPVFYQYGGCDRRPLGPGQIRFGNDPERFARLHEGAAAALAGLPGDCNTGVAPHSLRAVAPDSLPEIIGLAGDGPVHMHIAEQPGEVEEVLACHGQRPVEWFLDHVEAGPQWCLIHCTQMSEEETVRLARSGVVAGLCPLTEASLGDGIFNGVHWLDAGGRAGIGSDSNIRISLSEELRLLDYTQRLRDGTRAALASPDKSTGRRLFDMACHGGARAAGRDSGVLRPGALADLVALDDTDIVLAGRAGDALLDSFIFAGDDRLVRDVWSAGRHVVQEGHHIGRRTIVSRYRRRLDRLGDLL